MFEFTQASYHASWFVPNAFLTPGRHVPNQAAKNAVARDIQTGFGNSLQTRTDQLRHDWNGWTNIARYGSELNYVESLLAAVNALRLASGGTAVTLNEYDDPNLPAPPATPNPQPGLGEAWIAFTGARARARGNVIHHAIQNWVLGQTNVGYHTTGPDVDEHGGTPTVWYEIYPVGGRLSHASRAGMSSAAWREIQYDNGR